MVATGRALRGYGMKILEDPLEGPFFDDLATLS